MEEAQNVPKYQKIKTIFRKKSFWLIVIVILATGYYFYRAQISSNVQTQYITGQAAKGTITVSISGSGQLAAESQLDIKPSGSAKIVAVDVKQGQSVKAGQRIVMLDQTSALNSIAQAKASLASAKANYSSVLAGSTDIDLKLANSAVESAQLAYEKAQSDYKIIQQQQEQAVSKAFVALLNNANEAKVGFGNVSTAEVSISGSYTGQEQGEYRIITYMGGDGLHFNCSGVESCGSGLITKDIVMPLGTKGLYITFSSTGSLYSESVWTVSLPNLSSETYSTLNNSYQSALLSKQQSLQNAENSINTSKISLENAKTQLLLKQRGSTNSQIESAAASVTNAQAQLQTANTAYQNNIITAPFDGVIAQLSAKVGDQVNGNTAAAGSSNLATLITRQKIAAISLNEVDVAKIKLGDKTILTFDALPDVNMTGTVAQIDAIGTVSQGVVTYNVKISLDTDSDQIKPGMSVSANIITTVKTGVLMVPASAIKTDGNGSYVQSLKDGIPYNVAVQTGISNDTDTEITQGLNEGQEIIIQTITAPAASTTTGANRNAGFGGLGGGAAVRVIGR